MGLALFIRTEDRSLETTRQVKTGFIAFLGALLALLTLNLWMVAPYLLALLMGGILATLGHPLYRSFQKHGWNKKLSAIAVVIAIIFLVLIPLGFFGYESAKQGIEFAQGLSQDRRTFDFQGWIDTITSHPLARRLLGNSAQFQQRIQGLLQSAGTHVSAALLSAIGDLPAKILQAALSLLTCYFLLIDGGRLLGWMSARNPIDPDIRSHIFESFRDTAVSVIWATLAAAAVQGGILFVGFLVLGVPGAFLAAGATFLFAWIPLVGSTPVWLFGIIYLYVDGSPIRALLMLAFGLVTSIADNVVRPLVLRGRSDMHPLVALVSIFGGIQLFGLFGVFFGPVLMAVLLSLLDVWPLMARRLDLTSAQQPGMGVELNNRAQAQSEEEQKTKKGA